MRMRENKKIELILFDTVSNDFANGLNINAALLKSGHCVKDKKWLKYELLPWEAAAIAQANKVRGIHKLR